MGDSDGEEYRTGVRVAITLDVEAWGEPEPVSESVPAATAATRPKQDRTMGVRGLLGDAWRSCCGVRGEAEGAGSQG